MGLERGKSSLQMRFAVDRNVNKFIEHTDIEGKEHLEEIPKDKHIIVATSHLSDLDIPLVIQSLGKDLNLAISNASTQHDFKRNFQETLGVVLAGKSNFLPIDFAETGEKNVPLPFNPENYTPMAEAMDEGKAVLVAAHNPTEGELGRPGYGAVYLSQISGAVILPVAVNIPGPAIMMRKKETLRKSDATVIVGKPIELPHIEGIEEFNALLEKRRSNEEVTDADIERFKELSNKLREQSDMLMRILATMLPDEKRGAYGTQHLENSTDQ